jgi:hypothetical protein
MAHPVSTTDEEVFAILDRLDAAGAKISPNRVRTEANGGNPARYRLLIDRWRLARSLERNGGRDGGSTAKTALYGDIARVIEVELFTLAGFLDVSFRQNVARHLAGQIGSSLIRRGLVSEDALAEAPPDPFARFLGDETGRGDGGATTSSQPGRADRSR